MGLDHRADQYSAPLLFEDEELQEERKRRDPILPATASESAHEKKQTRKTAEGFPVHRFTTLLQALAGRARVPQVPSFSRSPRPRRRRPGPMYCSPCCQ